MAKKKSPNSALRDMFFTDHLTKEDKIAITAQYSAKDFSANDLIEDFVKAGFNVKLSWSGFNAAFSATVSPFQEEHPAFGKHYSAFHASWEKALFIVHFLMGDRYSFGDFTRGNGKVNDNDW